MDMAVMFKNETKALIEALLFVATEPLSSKDLSNIIGEQTEDISELVNELIAEYQNKKGGFKVIQVAGGFQFVTKPEFASYIEKLYRPQNNNGISKASLETLAIVAYKQPVTRGEIELIRGVKSDSSMNTLLEKNLVKEVGRKEGMGRPLLFGTSEEFLKHFGLKDLEELPNLEELISMEEE